MSYMNVEEIEGGLAALAGTYPQTCPTDRAAQSDRRGPAVARAAHRSGGRGGHRHRRCHRRDSRARVGAARTRWSISRPTCSRPIPSGPGSATAAELHRRGDPRPGGGAGRSSSFPASTPTVGTTARPSSQCGARTGAKSGPTRPLRRCRLEPQFRRALGFPASLRARLRRQRLGGSLPSAGLRRARGGLGAGDAQRGLAASTSTPATRWFIDVHSYVPAIYHTWGFDENQTRIRTCRSGTPPSTASAAGPETNTASSCRRTISRS